MLKAGILEIADIFVVNKADLSGADRTVQELRELLEYRDDGVPSTVGHHGAGTGGEPVQAAETGTDGESWEPQIVETVADRGEGIEELLGVLADHAAYLDESGERAQNARMRYASEIRTLLREDLNELLAEEIDHRGGLDQFVDRVRDRETDPYAVSDDLLDPIADCVRDRRDLS
jgi:LAO/AO transport system kinase